MSHLNFDMFHQFLYIKIDMSGNTFWPFFQYVNDARFARNLVKWDFFFYFQTLCFLLFLNIGSFKID